ncbi:MAG TPA: hypothetical protein VK753_05465 [Xanthomonadaceae bacterium]|jgi:hypothetical protein|nr:hypothetical protein [Xanthomonadaceae bacterium]
MPDNGRSPAVSGRNNRMLDAVLIGLPDAITSLWCLWVWMHPMALGTEAVKCVVLMMLMEFILLNATGFFTAIPFMFDLGRGLRAGMLLMLCAVYLLMIAVFAMQFHAIWPYFTFGWMVAGKLAWIARNRRVCNSEQMWLIGTWAVSVVAYLGAVGIGATQDVPYLGITPAIVPLLHLPAGGGEWIDTPHKAVASAVIYFAAVALFKWMYVAIRKNQPGRGRSDDTDATSPESFDPVA